MIKRRGNAKGGVRKSCGIREREKERQRMQGITKEKGEAEEHKGVKKNDVN